MLDRTLAEVDEASLVAMCHEKRGESSTLEWKGQLYTTSAQDKSEWAKDVAAFANLDGGDIVCGIAEANGGQADRVVAISSESPEAAERRLRQVLDSSIEPRISGLSFQPIQVKGGYTLAVRVPASYDGPHAIFQNTARRFVIRNGAGTADMSYEQIRQAFDRTATLTQQAREFIQTRHIAARGSQAPALLEAGPISELIVVPIAGLARRQTFDAARLFQSQTWPNLLNHRLCGGASQRLNFDGGVAYAASKDATSHYTQIFRNGCIETAFVCGRRDTLPRMGSEPVAYLYTPLVVHHLRQGFEMSLEQLKAEGFSGPAVVSVALLRIDGYALGTDDPFRQLSDTADRDQFVVPETWIEQLESVNVDTVIAPMIDALWQGFGIARCNYFDATTGVYKARTG